MGEIIEYEHHDNKVKVDKELKGKHRDHCLCFQCKKLDNCNISDELYEFVKKHGLVTPVYECPKFKPSKDNKSE